MRQAEISKHGEFIRIVDHLTKWRSPREQNVIDLLFDKITRGDGIGLERTLRNRTCASLRQRGVLTVERAQ